jgi:UDP-glucose 4-epimerase
MNKVLITGGSGFLGRYLINEFIIQGWDVTSVDKHPGMDIEGVNNITMQIPSPDFSVLLRETSPSLIVHAAGTASVPNSMIEPVADFDNNAVLMAQLLDAVRRHCPAARILYISSAAVYGNPTTLPVKETDPISPISPYGYTKYIGELLIEEYCRIFNLYGCTVRLFSAYGAGLRRQILWDICQKITKEHEVKLMGNGMESRDMIHAMDVARAISLLAAKTSFHGEVCNLASGVRTTIREMAEELIRAFGVEVPLVFTGERRAGDPYYWQADISRITELGFKITMDMKRGLNEYANWFMNHER